MTGLNRLGLAAALLLPAAFARAGSPTDPINVAIQMETALNSGNVEAFLAWFAPEGRVLERGGAVFATRDAVRGWAQAVMAHNYRATSSRHVDKAGLVRWEARVEFDDLRALGVQAVDSRGEATIAGGKVLAYTPAFSPGALALLASASAHQLEERVRTFIDLAYAQGKPEATDDWCAPELVDHNPLPGGFPSLEGMRAGITALRTAFPDLKPTVEDVIPAGDRVAARVTFTGTHKGPYLGVKATFRQVTFTAVEIFRLVDGKFVEHWSQLDLAGLNRQVGSADAGAAGGAAAPAAKEPRRKGNGGILGWLL